LVLTYALLELLDARFHGTAVDVDAFLHLGQRALQPLLSLLLPLPSLQLLCVKCYLEFVDLVLNCLAGLLQLAQHQLLLLHHLLLNSDEILANLAHSILYLVCSSL